MPTKKSAPKRATQSVPSINNSNHDTAYVGILILGIIIGVLGFLTYQYYMVQPVDQMVYSNDVTQLPPARPIPTASPDIRKPDLMPDTTSNWQMYSNDSFGFNLEYPAGWVSGNTDSNDPKNNPPEQAYFRPATPQPGDPEYGLVTISMYMAETSLENFANSILCGDAKTTCDIASKGTPISVGDMAGLKIMNPPSPIPSEVIVIKRNPFILVFRVALDKGYEETLSAKMKQEILDHMVNSLSWNN